MWGNEWDNVKDRKESKEKKKEPGAMNVLQCSRWIFTACHWKQSGVIKTEVNRQGECGFPKLPPPPPAPPCLLDGGGSAHRAQEANRFTSHSQQH